MPIVIAGAGGHAKVVAATAVACGHDVQMFLDDDPARWQTQVLGRPVGGPIERVLGQDAVRAIAAIGSNEVRRQLSTRFSRVDWIAAVHPAAFVHESVTIGAGSVVFAGAIVQPDAKIGRHAVINTGATVDHDCEIGDYVHLAPGVHLAGRVRVGTGAFLGAGAVAIPGVAIGDWAVVGAGAVVVRNVPPKTTVAGVPARALAK